MSLIVLAMVKNDKDDVTAGSESLSQVCLEENRIGVLNTTVVTDKDASSGDVEWDESLIPVVISSFFWGYLSSQLIGGRLAEMFGFKKVYGFGLFIPGLLFLIHPIAARCNVRLFIALRILVGVAEGVTWPAMHSITARWVPSSVRSSWVSKTYFGSTFGAIITYPMCGFIIDQFGWEPCFYVIAAITIVWTIVWYFIVYDDPTSHPRISMEELEEISDLHITKGRVPVPWLEILKSPPVWGTMVSDSGNVFGLSMFLSMGPVFFRYMLGLDIKSNGMLSSLPMFARYVGGVAIANFSDWLINSQRISTLNARRLFNSSSQVVPAAALVLLGYTGCDVTAALILMVLTYACCCVFPKFIF